MQIPFILKKFKSISNEDADPFYFEENPDLHLVKMQIHFILKKI